MNIFVLDLDPVEAAKAHCDKHVNKMLLESCQIMSTVHHQQNSPIADALYLPTHQNHPCVTWARSYRQNYRWLFKLATQLAEEFRIRYDKDHACEAELMLLKRYPPGMKTHISDICSKFYLAMPKEFHHANPIAAYRKYYHFKQTKMDMLWLRGRSSPSWWKNEMYEYYD